MDPEINLRLANHSTSLLLIVKSKVTGNRMVCFIYNSQSDRNDLLLINRVHMSTNSNMYL